MGSSTRSIRAVSIPTTPTGPPLTGWFARWFDEADDNAADEHGLSGVIHFLSDPVQTSEGTAFTIDLGSAPVAALEDLIDTVAGMGAASCRLATECLDEDDVPDEDDDEGDD